jgi:hypothetical protein
MGSSRASLQRHCSLSPLPRSALGVQTIDVPREDPRVRYYSGGQKSALASVRAFSLEISLDCLKKFKKWRRRVSIPVPLACEASALPCELRPPTRGV